MIEILKRVLRQALIFVGVGQRDGGHTLMPVPTVDQLIEFVQSIFEVIEASHAFHLLLPLVDCNFKGHGSGAEACQGYP